MKKCIEISLIHVDFSGDSSEPCERKSTLTCHVAVWLSVSFYEKPKNASNLQCLFAFMLGDETNTVFLSIMFFFLSIAKDFM